MTAIRFVQSRDVAVAYSVLARLDLGADAANLHDPSHPSAPWHKPLLEAYRAAPGRLLLHGLPLQYPDTLVDRLRDDPPPDFGGMAGQRLARLFADAFDDLGTHTPVWGSPPSDLIDPWSRLRAALWERRGTPPVWTIFDAPALRWAGRAIQIDGGQRIAVAFDRPRDHVLCQVFHETVHAVTDPVVLGGAPLSTRSTRAGDPGYAIHEAIEAAAIDVGEAIIEARAPEFVAAYREWRSR